MRCLFRTWAVTPQLGANLQKFLLLCMGTVLMVMPVLSAAANDWPLLTLPKGIKTFDVGEQLSVNGLPMRIMGFVTDQSVAKTVDGFRTMFGARVVENTLGEKRVIGQAQGNYYVTVQIEAANKLAANGTAKGIIAVTHLSGAIQEKARVQESAAKWRDYFPAGTKVISQMASEDYKKSAFHIVLSNQHSETLNEQNLIAALEAQGFVLERKVVATDKINDQLASSMQGGRTLFFKGHNKEATAMIVRDQKGLTSIVVNTRKQIESFQ